MENTQVNTRLLINLREGIVEAEGGEEFVRSVYDDFKERVSKPVVFPLSEPKQLSAVGSAPEQEEVHEQPKKRARKSRGSETGKARAAEYKPEFNAQLNLADLENFYDGFEPANSSEKILIFAIFLRDKLGVVPCAANDIYSCFFMLKHKTKTPEAFVQAFRDTQHRTHFIEFVSPQHVKITIAGDNHFNQKLKRKGAATE